MKAEAVLFLVALPLP